MSRHREFTEPGIVGRITGLSGSVTSTIPSPQERPISAYSRPEGAVYPQQSAPLGLVAVEKPGKLLRGIQVLRLMFRLWNTSSAPPPTGECGVAVFHGSGAWRIGPTTAGCRLRYRGSSSSSASTERTVPATAHRAARPAANRAEDASRVRVFIWRLREGGGRCRGGGIGGAAEIGRS